MYAIREAATVNVKKLIEKFGTEWVAVAIIRKSLQDYLHTHKSSGSPIPSIMLHFTTVRRHFDRFVRLVTPTISTYKSVRELQGPRRALVCDSRATPNI